MRLRKQVQNLAQPAVQAVQQGAQAGQQIQAQAQQAPQPPAGQGGQGQNQPGRVKRLGRHIWSNRPAYGIGLAAAGAITGLYLIGAPVHRAITWIPQVVNNSFPNNEIYEGHLVHNDDLNQDGRVEYKEVKQLINDQGHAMTEWINHDSHYTMWDEDETPISELYADLERIVWKEDGRKWDLAREGEEGAYTFYVNGERQYHGGINQALEELFDAADMRYMYNRWTINQREKGLAPIAGDSAYTPEGTDAVLYNQMANTVRSVPADFSERVTKEKAIRENR